MNAEEIVNQITSLSIKHVFHEYVHAWEHGYKAITYYKTTEIRFARITFSASYTPVDNWNIHEKKQYGNRNFSKLNSPTAEGASKFGLVVPKVEHELNEVVDY